MGLDHDSSIVFRVSGMTLDDPLLPVRILITVGGKSCAYPRRYKLHMASPSIGT